MKRWEEIPVPVPERFLQEVENVLKKNVSPFLHFLQFSNSGEKGGSQNSPQNAESIPSGPENTPLTNKTWRNGETGEMEKREYSTSSQDEKSLNKADINSLLQPKTSVLHGEKTENEEPCPYWNGEYCEALGYAAFKGGVLEKGLKPPCLGGSDRCPAWAWRQDALRKRRLEREAVEEALAAFGG